jgi:hypothetical protein
LSIIRGRIYTIAGSAAVSAGLGLVALLATAPQAGLGPVAGPNPQPTAARPGVSHTEEARTGGSKHRAAVKVFPQLVDKPGRSGGRTGGGPPPKPSPSVPARPTPAPTRSQPGSSPSPQPTKTVTAAPPPSTVPIIALPCTVQLISIRLGLCGPSSDS